VLGGNWNEITLQGKSMMPSYLDWEKSQWHVGKKHWQRSEYRDLISIFLIFPFLFGKA